MQWSFINPSPQCPNTRRNHSRNFAGRTRSWRAISRSPRKASLFSHNRSPIYSDNKPQPNNNNRDNKLRLACSDKRQPPLLLLVKRRQQERDCSVNPRRRPIRSGPLRVFFLLLRLRPPPSRLAVHLVPPLRRRLAPLLSSVNPRPLLPLPFRLAAPPLLRPPRPCLGPRLKPAPPSLVQHLKPLLHYLADRPLRCSALLRPLLSLVRLPPLSLLHNLNSLSVPLLPRLLSSALPLSLILLHPLLPTLSLVAPHSLAARRLLPLLHRQLLPSFLRLQRHRPHRACSVHRHNLKLPLHSLVNKLRPPLSRASLPLCLSPRFCSLLPALPHSSQRLRPHKSLKSTIIHFWRVFFLLPIKFCLVLQSASLIPRRSPRRNRPLLLRSSLLLLLPLPLPLPLV